MEIKQQKTISFEELLEMEAKNNPPKTQKTTTAESKPSETKEKSPNDKFYLPVLNLNWAQEWPTKPVNERKHWTDEAAMNTCLGNCCGVEGLKGACCHLDPYDLEHVLGPLDEDWIKSTVKWFRNKGFNFSRQDLVIDYEEGKIIGENLFKDSPNNNIFLQPTAYPILRFQVIGPRYACKFMNPMTYKCSIYEIRPKMCSTYYCQYIATNFLVKVQPHPNRYVKIR